VWPDYILFICALPQNNYNIVSFIYSASTSGLKLHLIYLVVF